MNDSSTPATGSQRGWGSALAVVYISFFLVSASMAQPQTPLLGLGDSIGEGVQSADASWRTQAFTYLSWIGLKMQVPFPQPLIRSSPLGTVGDTVLRSRISPQTEALNVAVSGADVNSLLNNRADAVTESEIDSETDLVIFPRLATQIEIAESLTPTWVVCWIGNNDALGAATDWNHLDASQLTSIEEFSSRFSEITQRLGDLPSNVVLGNIPNVTRIGFLMDGQDLIRFLGSDFGLAEGDYTSLVTMLIIKLGLNNGSILQDPDFVLDAGEVALVQERIGDFNEVIQERADLIDAAVVDVHTFVEVFASTPVTILGIPISPRFLGGSPEPRRCAPFRNRTCLACRWVHRGGELPFRDQFSSPHATGDCGNSSQRPLCGQGWRRPGERKSGGRTTGNLGTVFGNFRRFQRLVWGRFSSRRKSSTGGELPAEVLCAQRKTCCHNPVRREGNRAGIRGYLPA